MAWLDEHTLAVGNTYHTNEEGIRQLSVLSQPLGVQVITVSLLHHKGLSDVFHLMSRLCKIDTNLAVVYPPLMPIVFHNLMLQRGYQFIKVPDTEIESMGCKVLAAVPREA